MTVTTTTTVAPSSGASHVIPARRVVKKDAIKTPGLLIQLLTAGTAACVADMITFPLDTTKVRLQVTGRPLITRHNFGVF
jgi:hypothetical protein